MYRNILFLLVLVLANSVDGRRPKDQIRQCKCTELEECRQDNLQPLMKCQEKCIRRLENADWDKEEGQKCLMTKKTSEHDECMKDAFSKTCDNEPGKFLSVNETNEHRHKRHHHRRHRSVDNSTVVSDGSDHEKVEATTADVESVEDRRKNQHKQREHHKAAFHAFIQKNFGKSGKNFVKCMNSCSHKLQKSGNCARKLRCGTKRLPADEWKAATSVCDKKKKPRRYETCDCLQKAGVKNLDCTFDGRRDEQVEE